MTHALPSAHALPARAILGGLALAGAAALPLLLALPFLRDPLFGDEAVYSTVARGWLDGQLPYHDLFDNKPPLLYGWYALSFQFFGAGVEGPRILAALALSATTLLVFAQGRMIASERVAYLAAALFALSCGLVWVSSEAASEAFTLPPLVGSLVAFTAGVRSQRLAPFAIAGLLAGLAIMTKQVAVWNAAAFVLLVLPCGVAMPRRRVLGAATFAGGAAVALAAVIAPFVAVGPRSRAAGRIRCSRHDSAVARRARARRLGNAGVVRRLRDRRALAWAALPAPLHAAAARARAAGGRGHRGASATPRPPRADRLRRRVARRGRARVAAQRAALLRGLRRGPPPRAQHEPTARRGGERQPPAGRVHRRPHRPR
jgi:hypothetical protein